MVLFNTSDIPEIIKNNQPIVLIDGDCNLCNRSVKFLIKHNLAADLKFASLKSDIGVAILNKAAHKTVQDDTLLFMENNILYGYSTAALKIATHLNYPWRLFGVFIIIPVTLRDRIYRYVAANRYKWFGRSSYCNTDGEKMLGRFLS